MKTMHMLAAGAAALALATPALAQKSPAAIIVTVDTQRVSNECNACKTAAASLQSQVTALRTRSEQLGQSLQTEGQGLQTAVGALQGKQPDAALQARITAFQQKQNNAQAELQKTDQTITRNRNYVLQQINTKLDPIFQQVMQAHGANIALDTSTTLAAATGVDVTAEVLAALNKSLTTISTTAPAQATAPGR